MRSHDKSCLYLHIIANIAGKSIGEPSDSSAAFIPKITRTDESEGKLHMYVHISFGDFLDIISRVEDIYEDDRYYGKRNNNFVLTQC